jgi:hypothetical protein
MSLRSGRWLVTKYDGLKVVWERTLPAASFTTNQISHVLRALVATDLTAEEVMGAFDPSVRNHLLDVKSDEVTRYNCGENPHYTAVHD